MCVRLEEETEVGGYRTKIFCLLSLEEEQEICVRMVFCPSWPHHCSPLAIAADLIRVSRGVHRMGGSGGEQPQPMVVVDRFGGTEAATFCALSSLLRQLDFEGHVDVYQYAKVAHQRRPGIWKSPDDYLYLYRWGAE